MKKYRAILLILFLSAALPLSANKASVIIEAPEKAQKDETVKIKITVMHNIKSIIHYTNWAVVSANGKEIARWVFTSKKPPEKNIFIRELSYKVKTHTEIEAQANCNIHGSSGITKVKIDLK